MMYAQQRFELRGSRQRDRFSSSDRVMEHPTPPTRAVCAVVCIRVAVVKCLAVLCICVHARLEARRDKKNWLTTSENMI